MADIHTEKEANVYVLCENKHGQRMFICSYLHFLILETKSCVTDSKFKSKSCNLATLIIAVSLKSFNCYVHFVVDTSYIALCTQTMGDYFEQTTSIEVTSLEPPSCARK